MYSPTHGVGGTVGCRTISHAMLWVLCICPANANFPSSPCTALDYIIWLTCALRCTLCSPQHSRNRRDDGTIIQLTHEPRVLDKILLTFGDVGFSTNNRGRRLSSRRYYNNCFSTGFASRSAYFDPTVHLILQRWPAITYIDFAVLYVIIIVFFEIFFRPHRDFWDPAARERDSPVARTTRVLRSIIVFYYYYYYYYVSST